MGGGHIEASLIYNSKLTKNEHSMGYIKYLTRSFPKHMLLNLHCYTNHGSETQAEGRLVHGPGHLIREYTKAIFKGFGS